MKLKTFLYSFSLGCCSVIYLNTSFANSTSGSIYLNNDAKKNFTSQIDEVFTAGKLEVNSKSCSINNELSLKESAAPVGPVVAVSKVLSYGDNFSQELQPTSTWVIKNVTTQATLGSGTGSISNFNFPIPGDYSVEVVEVISCIPGECEHTHDPSLISILVSPHKMTFDFSTIQFSEPIIGGQDYSNLQINIEVLYENYFNQNATFSNCNVISAGIRTTFIGSVNPMFQNLSLGINELSYTISGKATKDTYIMFDFIDINNQVVSYYYPTKIN